MSIEVRPARAADIDAVLPLVQDFVTSFEVEEGAYRESFTALVAQEDAALLVALDGDTVIGYCLGFNHHTFYANGPVAWVEEITVSAKHRRGGAGQQLMTVFEAWAKSKGCTLCALATRRAADFYLAIGYEESATYFRKIL